MNAITTILPIASRIIAGCTAETVHARKLHKFLEVGRDYSNWIKARIGSYGFTENEDYVLVRQNGRTKNHGGDRRSIEHYITLDMAKELAMVERNEKGREARRYFIKCETRLKAELKEKLQDTLKSQARTHKAAGMKPGSVTRILMAVRNGDVVYNQVISPTSIVIEAENLAQFVEDGEFFPTEILPNLLRACTNRLIDMTEPKRVSGQPDFI